MAPISETRGDTAAPAAAFFIGCEDPTLLDALEHLNPNAQAIVLEPDPARAATFLSRRDWSHWQESGRLVFLAGPDYAGASGSWRPTVVPAEPPVVVDPWLDQHRPDDVESALAVVRRLVDEARANAEARRTHAGRYLLHTLANTATIAREGDVRSLFGAFDGVPAVIVGAGPSIDGRLHEIGAMAERALVIACDTAARPLLATGVSPRFIVGVDPAEANAMHLAALHHPRASWLVAEGSLHPTAFASFDRRAFVFNVSDHHPWPWLATLGIERGRLDAWGSVATSALDFALKLGCSPILFAGLDFAFTGGRTYCRGTTFEHQWAAWMGAGESLDAIATMLMNRWPLVLEPDADGRMVRTAPHLVSFRNWIRQRIEATPSVRFINVTPEGLLHHPRIERMPFEQALAGADPLNSTIVDALLRAAHQRTPPASARLFAGIERLLSACEEGQADPRGDWSAFAGRGIKPALFSAALSSHEYEAWRQGRMHS